MGMDNCSTKEIITRGLGIFEDLLVVPIAERITKMKISYKISPNLISITKFILIFLFPVILFSHNGNTIKSILTLLLFYIFSILDRLDGGFARLQNKETKMGELIDGLIDKLLEMCILISLGIYLKMINVFLVLIIFILFISYISERVSRIYKRPERQEYLYKYLNFKNIKNYFVFFILVITRNDIRRILISCSILFNFLMLIPYYYATLYSIYFFHIWLFSLKNQ